jgi:hypothetical protein
MVTVMTDEERRAAWNQVTARSLVMLDPKACAAVVREETAQANAARPSSGRITERQVSPLEKPDQRLTDAESARVNKQWADWIDERIAAAVSAALAESDERWIRTVGETVILLRGEITAAVGELRADLVVEKVHGDPKIIDLPVLPLKGERRA